MARGWGGGRRQREAARAARGHAARRTHLFAGNRILLARLCDGAGLGLALARLDIYGFFLRMEPLCLLVELRADGLDARLGRIEALGGLAL